MVERLHNRITQAFIASALGLSAIGIAAAADSTTTPDTTATPPSPSSSTMPPADPSAAGTPRPTPAAGAAASDGTMAPRGANPSAAGDVAPPDSPAKRIFDQLDTNHDGSLSLEEFSRATFQQPAKQ